MKYNNSMADAREYARQVSKTVVIRTYDDGNSYDYRRESTNYESERIEIAITSALIAISAGYDVDTAKCMAECFIICDENLNHSSDIFTRINAYDSVYIPLCEYLESK